MFLRSDDGQYLVAELGGGGEVHCDRTVPGAWESFGLDDVDGPPLRHGDAGRLRTHDGQHWLSAEGGGGSALHARGSGPGAWETFRLYVGQAPSATSGEVLPEDTVLVPSRPRGAVLGTVTGYEMSSHCPFAAPRCERPMYLKYDRDDPEWWDVLVDELLASRVNVVMAHGRGCYSASSGDDGNGNMCPRRRGAPRGARGRVDREVHPARRVDRRG